MFKVSKENTKRLHFCIFCHFIVQCSISYRNQPFHFHCESYDWFLYKIHQWLNWFIRVVLSVTLNRYLETGLHLKNFWKLILFGLKSKDLGKWSHWDRIGVHSFSMYAKVSEKLTSLSLWHAHVFAFNWMLEHNRVRNLFILLLLLLLCFYHVS